MALIHRKRIVTIIFVATIQFFTGCARTVSPPKAGPIPPSAELSTVTHKASSDLKSIEIRIPRNLSFTERQIEEILMNYSGKRSLDEYLDHLSSDFNKHINPVLIHNEISQLGIHRYTISGIYLTKTTTILTFEEDSAHLKLVIGEIIKNHRKQEPEPRTHLPSIDSSQTIVPEDSLLRNLNLLLPCPGVHVPVKSTLLPNAPRTYRSGTHKGIDFPASFGSEVRAVSDGIVIRADHNYTEIEPDFRASLLNKAAVINRTPSDIFNHILLGQSIFIDHGIDVIPGKRVISIYAHLSNIDKKVQVGEQVKRGQKLGLVGNSGTRDGALGNINGAHLHFELIIQDEKGEKYLGEGVEYIKLYSLLSNIFHE